MTATSKTQLQRTEASVIPSDWQFRSLVALLSEKPKYGINASAVEYSTDLPRYLRITDITANGRYTRQKEVSVAADNASDFYLNSGDVVVARTGASVGKGYLYLASDGPLVYAGFLIRLRADASKLLPEYLFAYMQTNLYWNWVQVMSTRSGQPGINGQEYGQLPVPLPPIPEQARITAILSAWDRAIELTERLIAAKQKRKQALMQQLLTGKKRKTVKLSSVVKRVNDPINPDPNTLYREIGIRSHGKGIFHKEPVTGKSLGDKRVYRIHPDCFVFNVVFAWEQAISQTTSAEEGMIASHRFPMYQPIEDKIDLDYLVYFFKTGRGKHLLGLASPGGAGRNRTLSQSGFLKTKIPLPPIKEQRRISIILTTTDLELKLLDRQRLARTGQEDQHPNHHDRDGLGRLSGHRPALA